MEKIKKWKFSAKTDTGETVYWNHPGGKLRRLGPEKCTDVELLAVLIGAGAAGKTALEIAKEISDKFTSFKGIANQPLEKLCSIKSLKEVKATRIAAAFEIARRIVTQVVNEREK